MKVMHNKDATGNKFRGDGFKGFRSGADDLSTSQPGGFQAKPDISLKIPSRGSDELPTELTETIGTFQDLRLSGRVEIEYQRGVLVNCRPVLEMQRVERKSDERR